MLQINLFIVRCSKEQKTIGSKILDIQPSSHSFLKFKFQKEKEKEEL